MKNYNILRNHKPKLYSLASHKHRLTNKGSKYEIINIRYFKYPIQVKHNPRKLSNNISDTRRDCTQFNKL